MAEKAIRCACGKLIAKERDGKIFLWCKECRQEVELKIEKESHYEPKIRVDWPMEHKTRSI